MPPRGARTRLLANLLHDLHVNHAIDLCVNACSLKDDNPGVIRSTGTSAQDRVKGSRSRS